MSRACRHVRKLVLWKLLPVHGNPPVWERRSGFQWVIQQYWVNPDGPGQFWDDEAWLKAIPPRRPCLGGEGAR